MSKGLPKRSEDYSLWYNELVKKADLAENSPVRGCMVIKPYGYSIWEKMQAELDKQGLLLQQLLQQQADVLKIQKTKPSRVDALSAVLNMNLWFSLGFRIWNGISLGFKILNDDFG